VKPKTIKDPLAGSLKNKNSQKNEKNPSKILKS
jgi:hypothetical protein